MSIWELVVAAYLVVTVYAAVMTHCEQRQSGERKTLHKIMGFAACAVWPLVVAAALISGEPEAEAI